MPLQFLDQQDETKPAEAASQAVPRLRTMDPYAPGGPDPMQVLTNTKPLQNKMANLGIRGGGPALGQTIGAATGPLAPVAVPVLGGIGGGLSEALAQFREGNGFHPGAIFAATGTGAVPGSWMAKGGLAVAGLKGAALNTVSQYAQKGIDQDRVPTLAELLLSDTLSAGGGAGAAKLAGAKQLAVLNPQEQLMIGRDRAFRQMRPFGITVPPSDVGKGSDMIGGIGGAAPTRYAAIAKNQPGWQAATREDLGLSGNGPLFPKQYQDLRKALAAPYQQMQDISENAQAQLEKFRAAGPTAIDGPSTAALQDYDKSVKHLTDPLVVQAAGDIKALPGARLAAHQAMVDWKNQVQGATYDKWQALKGSADELENKIEAAAISAGKPDLAKAIANSRRLISKSYLAQATTNPDNGLVSPKGFGDVSWEAGTRGIPSPLDANMQKMAAFYNNFDRLGKTVTDIPAAGVNQLNSKLSWMNLPALVHGSLGKPARNFMLSEAAQNSYAAPRLVSTFGNDLAAQTFRQAALAQGREEEPLSDSEMARLEELRALKENPDNANP